MFTGYSIAKSLINRHKRKNPKRSHFKIKKPGIIWRAAGVDKNVWFIQYKPTGKPIEIPFTTKEAAEEWLDGLLEELRKED